VLEQNKDGAKENDGGKANYDFACYPDQARICLHCETQSLCGSRIPRKQ
jgi:hypothetical protein